MTGKTGKRVFTDMEVATYRQDYMDGRIASRDIVKATRVNKETIMRMLRGDTYRHVPMAKPKAQMDLEQYMSLRRMVLAGLARNPDDTVTTIEQFNAQFNPYAEARAVLGLKTAAEDDLTVRMPEPPQGDGMKRLEQEMSKHPDILLRELKGMPPNPLDE